MKKILLVDDEQDVVEVPKRGVELESEKKNNDCRWIALARLERR